MIAGHLPGRTDNEIKNYWNSHLTRKIYRYRFIGESTLSAADMLKLVTKTKQKLGRPSRTAAAKFSNNANSAASLEATAEQPPGSDCLPLANAVPAEPSVSSCYTLSAEGWPDALMLPPDDAQAMEMLGPLTEVDDEILMHLKYFLEDGTTDRCQDVSNGSVMNTDNRVSSEESGCGGGWSSNSDPADLYACSSPVVSYFTDDLQWWDHGGAGDELNLWSEEEDILIWSWNRHK